MQPLNSLPPIWGLSPRVRGKHAAAELFAADLGSIPACAGETAGLPLNMRRCKVYPRVCGGNAPKRLRRPAPCGLSPRVRGKRQRRHANPGRGRSIPACAGETAAGSSCPRRRGVYPRVCGGNALNGEASPPPAGLSPRVRGKPPATALARTKSRSIPACAGETVLFPQLDKPHPVYPRVCGGNGPELAAELALQGLSPRVRGKLSITAAPSFPGGSIPACAGETGR